METRCLCDILSAELGARLPPRDTVAIEMCEHRGAVDVEAGDKLGYGVPLLVRGNEPRHVSASESALDLSIARSEPCGAPASTSSRRTHEARWCSVSAPGSAPSSGPRRTEETCLL